MQGIWLGDQKLSIKKDLPDPKLSDKDALIELLLAGICSTDLEMVKGYYSFSNILGHEFVGKVIHAPGYDYLVGKRVVGEINITCGECKECLNGRSSHCENRKTLGISNYPGVFAEYLKLPVKNLHLVPDSLSNEQAVFSELLAAALEIQQQIHIMPSSHVLVVGAGRLGMLIAQCLALTGCDLKVVVRRAEAARMLSTFGIRSITPDEVFSHMADVVVEVTGSSSGFELSRSAVRPRGTLVLKSTFAGDVSLNLSSIVVDEVTLMGSRCGPFEPALRLLEERLIKVEPLISAYYPLKEGLAAMEMAGRPGVLKVLLHP